MATTYDFDLAVKKAAELLKTLDRVAECDTEIPGILQSGPGTCHGAVLMEDGEMGQSASQQRQNIHNVILRFYIVRNPDAPGAEELGRKLIEDVQVLFEANVTLENLANVELATVEGNYRARYQEWPDNVMVRVLDMPLQIDVKKGVTWQQT